VAEAARNQRQRIRQGDRKPSRSRYSVRPAIFGSAANNGQMIAEIAASHRTTEMFLQSRNG